MLSPCGSLPRCGTGEGDWYELVVIRLLSVPSAVLVCNLGPAAVVEVEVASFRIADISEENWELEVTDLGKQLFKVTHFHGRDCKQE